MSGCKINKAAFENYYNTCFDSNGNIKACGRQSCKNLLVFLGCDKKYGDVNTGMLNIAAINALHERLNS